MVADPEVPIPELARSALRALMSALEELKGEIGSLEAEITRRAIWAMWRLPSSAIVVLAEAAGSEPLTTKGRA